MILYLAGPLKSRAIKQRRHSCKSALIIRDQPANPTFDAMPYSSRSQTCFLVVLRFATASSSFSDSRQLLRLASASSSFSDLRQLLRRSQTRRSFFLPRVRNLLISFASCMSTFLQSMLCHATHQSFQTSASFLDTSSCPDLEIH